jgi:hypothetical protein
MVKTKKKSMNKSNQFKLCRNKICADTRSIKVNKKIKRRKTIYINLYYFLDTSKKKIYLVEKDSYETLKDKVGYLIEVSYSYGINEFFNNRHQITLEIAIFTKYSLDEIKANPSWSNDTGISKEMPYSFAFLPHSMGGDKMPKKIKIIKTKGEKGDKLDKNILNKYIKSMTPKLNKIDYDDYPRLSPYEDTYANLLDKYYNECLRTNIDVFKMVYYA